MSRTEGSVADCENCGAATSAEPNIPARLTWRFLNLRIIQNLVIVYIRFIIRLTWHARSDRYRSDVDDWFCVYALT
jgi:hypothetical protein